MQEIAETEEKPFKKRFKRFFKSKFVVLLTLILTTIGLLGGIAKSSADNIDLSGVYQYFLLDNQNGYDSDDKKAGHDILHPTGILGSGGNHGRFNYSQIVEGAGSSNKQSAEQFCGEMATLSGYHYFNVTNQGFSGILNHAGVFLEGLLLVPFGLIIDMSNVIYRLFSNLIVKYNVFTMLGNAFGNTHMASGLADAFGISTGLLKEIVSLAMVAFAIILMLGVIKALSQSDPFSGNHWKKPLQRIIGFLAMPVVITFCAMIVNDLTANNVKVTSQKPVFANYITDVQTWAEDNFNMNVGGAKEISGSDKDGTFLDSSWNPYADNGKNAARIGQALFKQGPLAGTAFPNTALAIELMSGHTFTGQDYLSYIESTHNSNGVNQVLGNFGKGYKNLYDNKKSYTSMGTCQKNWTISGTPFDKAYSDYVKKQKHITGPAQTWVERYIYGAKNAGDLKDYYGAAPSKEQVYADFGGNSSGGQRLSDASTFLALNTKFDVDGGTFSLNNPAQGIKGTIASFAYQTPVWSSYALIGSALYTLPAMIGSAIFTLIIVLATLMAILKVGLIEMNIDPLRAWFKSIFKGDLEYTYASVVYAVGIMGTVILVSYIGPVLSTGFNKIVNFLFTPLTQNITFNPSGTPSVGGTELIGLSGIVTFVVALYALRLYSKNRQFREGVMSFMIFPWEWAKGVGERLERQADGNLMADMKDHINQRTQRGDRFAKKRSEFGDQFGNALSNVATGESRGGRLANKLTGGLAGKVARGMQNASQLADPNADVDTSGGLSKKQALKRQMAMDGAKQRLENALAMLPIGKKLDHNVDEAIDDLDKNAPEFVPDEDGMLNVDDPRLTDEQRKEAQDINDEQQALDQEQQGLDQDQDDLDAEQAELDAEQAQIDKDREELERQHDAGEISDEEYEKRKAELDQRQAEHDAKQADLNRRQAEHDILQGKHDEKQDLLNDRRQDLMDAVNGTASVNHEGKFNLDNPNFTDEERQEAAKLNGEQDTINQENDSIAEDRQKLDEDKQQLADDIRDYQEHKNEMSPDKREETRKELATRQQDIASRENALDSREKNNQNAQAELSSRQHALMDKVSQENSGQTITNAQRNAHKHTAAGLAEQARINGTKYEEMPNAQNAATMIESLQAMKDEAQRLNIPPKKLYGFDIDQQIKSIEKATPLPKQSGQQMMQLGENPDGSFTVTTTSTGLKGGRKQDSLRNNENIPRGFSKPKVENDSLKKNNDSKQSFKLSSSYQRSLNRRAGIDNLSQRNHSLNLSSFNKHKK